MSGLLSLGVGLSCRAAPSGAASGPDYFSGAGSPFEEPLIATAPTTPREDAALSRAIAAYLHQGTADDFAAFTQFLAQHPKSGWRVALLTNLGLADYHYGRFSQAIAAWEAAWREGRQVTEPQARALVDRALGELARMHARLGHADRLAALFAEIRDRPVSGAATETLAGAKEGLWVMRNEPGIAYLCGPMALKSLLLAQGVPAERLAFLDNYRSGPHGVSLAEVAQLADEAKLSYRLVHRALGEPVPIPSIVHWKVGHFAAIVGAANGRFRVLDPTFGEGELWVTQSALDDEASGYFLVPGSSAAKGWRAVDAAEASAVRGMGFPAGKDTAKGMGLGNVTAHAVCTAPGMCGYNILEMLVSLSLVDTPVGYTPPKGPSVKVTLTYNQREANQPAVFSFFNVSPKWTLNFLSYIQDDPTNPGANVTRYAAGGGSIGYLGFTKATNAFTPETGDASVLVRGTGATISYQRQLPDGGHELYAQSDGAARFPRRIFLSQIVDPAGNTVTLNYDGQLRLTSLTDATGRATTFSYGLAKTPLLITAITDPFGRSAKLDYDDQGRLVQITDVLGLTSRFTYDSSSMINALVTPYGATTFAYGDTPTSRFLEVTDPLDNREREEWIQPAPGIPGSDPGPTVPKGLVNPSNGFLNGRDSFFWDKHALAVARGDYTKARMTHFAHVATNMNLEANIVESIKYPFESRIWFNYPGQNNASWVTGALDKPSRVGRVLDDGSTQLRQTTYNKMGKPTQIIDAAGRQTNIDYAANQIDAVQVTRVTPGGNAVLAAFTYNDQHRPLTSVDAAGQTTSYSYNSAGQLTQVTDPLKQTTKYAYDDLGRLTTVVNADNKTTGSYTYDNFDRVATYTDSEGYRVSYAYDALDRITAESFPDGSSRQYTYDKLDLVAVKDRQGRVTRYGYDANRNLVAVTDPLGRTTRYVYYENGVLKNLIDPEGNVTSWDIDVESRVTAKRYADGRVLTNGYENTTGRLKTITDALGQVKQVSYTPDDRVAGIDYAKAVNPTPGVRFSYDPSYPRLLSMTDASGTTLYQYLPVGSLGALKLLSETGPYPNATVAYRYDALGRMAARTVDTNSESFAYDALGRTTSHVSALGTFALSYLGETKQMTGRHLVGGGAGTDWSYQGNDNDRRLAAIANGAAVRGYQLSTTPENIIARIVETAGGATAGQSWDYAHDDANRLLQGQSSGGAHYAYGYDADDNLTSIASAAGSAGASYNALDQVSSVASQAFLYDADGNLTDDGTRTYRWDAENRLIAVGFKADPSKQVTLRYDGLGRRSAIVATTGGNTSEVHYLWCATELCQARDGQDTVTRRYYGEGEMILASGTALFYAEDQLGSVRDVTAADGSRVASYDYDPLGNLVQGTGAAGTDFRYAGMFYQPDSGLYLTPYRAYDSKTGRWLSRDPLAENGGTNLYAYAGGDPIEKTDPLGLCSDRPVGGRCADIIGQLCGMGIGILMSGQAIGIGPAAPPPPPPPPPIVRILPEDEE